MEAWFPNADRPVVVHCQKKFGESLTFDKAGQPVVIRRKIEFAGGLKRRMDGDERRQFALLADAVAKNRDKAAFAQLFTFFAPRLKSFLMRQSMGAMEAEELVQEVMVVLWNKAHLYDPAKSSLSTWLFRVARNRRIDAARRKRAARLDEHDMALHPTAPPAPDDVVDMTDREDVVQRAIKRLPQEQLHLVQLAFFLGRSHSEIAAETGLPLGTVKSRLRLAFGKLRALLGEQGIESAS